MIFAKSKHNKKIAQKEVLISKSKKKLEKSMDKDIAKLNKLNKILGNGIALQIYTVTGSHK